MVVAAPVIVDCFPLICVWIAEVTPERYHASVDVTEEIAILPLPSETISLEAVRSLETTVVAAPVIVACFPFN